MTKVKIYRLNNDGSQRVIAVCRLENKTVICEGDKKFVDYLSREGIMNYSVTLPTKIFLKDGMLFLEQLKNAFRSGYLTASGVLEE